MSVNTLIKANRLLTQRRLQIAYADLHTVQATVRGDTDTYAVGYEGNRWHCSCAARGASCSHIEALRSVILTDPSA